MTVHENNDTMFLVHQIITYDYNNHLHDNVTCSMTFTPFENNMFVLEHDGLHDYNCKLFNFCRGITVTFLDVKFTSSAVN